MEKKKKCHYCGKKLGAMDLYNGFCSEDCLTEYHNAKEFTEHFPKGTDY